MISEIKTRLIWAFKIMFHGPKAWAEMEIEAQKQLMQIGSISVSGPIVEAYKNIKEAEQANS